MSLRITSVAHTAGFLENCEVQFARGLTCVIGARGTCKSTLIEGIRFAFNADLEKIKTITKTGARDDPSERDGVIRATLRGGTVRCDVEIEHKNGVDNYVIERELDSESRLYKDGVRAHTDTEILEHIEIYSQGDLQRIAEEDNFRLELVERPFRAEIQALKTARATAGSKLKEVGERLRVVRNNIEQVAQQLKALPPLREQLSALRGSMPQVSAELEKLRAAHRQREQTLAELRTAREIVREADGAFAALRDAMIRLRESAQAIEAVEQPSARPALEAVFRALSLIASSVATGESIHEIDLDDAINKVAAQFDMESEDYYRTLKQANEYNEQLKKEETLRKQVEHFEAQDRYLQKLRDDESKLISERGKFRSEISLASSKIYELRIAEVERINQQHGKFILLTLQSGLASKDYVGLLFRLLSGSRIRNQEEVARDLATKLPPSALIDIVEKRDVENLAKTLDRDIGQMTRVVSHLADHPDLYNIETSYIEDRLEITLYDSGVPKAVSDLSEGQRATALLPLILRSLPYPLIFDQPEDDLDNKFIIESLVDSISKLKEVRQLIFVTHNANIPVLGEADQIVVMSMASPTSAEPPLTGTVDERKKEILSLLEGGAEAFLKRQNRYRPLLGG